MGDAFATSVASNLVSKLGEFLIAPIGRQFGYVLCYKSYVEDLEKELKELESARERVQHSVQVAENDGKPIENDIKNWLERVNEETEQADNLSKRGQSAKDACFRGWLPNPVVRHPIGRKVKKMTQVIQGLREKSRESNFQKVYYENPPIGIVTGTTSATKFVDSNEDVLESRAKITEDVLKAIVDDMVCVIGVWGPGGVGKSKLLEDVERRVKQEKLFDLIATANVSRNPVKTIQGDIAYALGLKLMNEESARGRADLLCKKLESDPEKSDIEKSARGRADLLCKKLESDPEKSDIENSDPPKNILEKSDIENSNPLKKIHRKKILIILDNLWDKLELKEVGIPCGYDNKVRGCKLLVTSRNRDVLRTDMGSDQVFELSKLEHGEARRLFERTVGDKAKDLEFEPLVDGLVKNCRGLPLLIVAMAKRLKHRDLAAWKIAPTHIDAPVKSIVEESYNGLNDKTIKSLFLVCALTSGRILMRTCLVYCMGLGLYKEFSETIQNARDRLIMGLHSLQDSSLLLDSVDMELFKMHDEFVDKAISIASTEWNALVGRKDCGFNEWSKDELRKCIAISFHYVGIDDLPNKLDCPNLTMLLLLESNPSLKVHESFFESMEKLQVLDLSSLSFTSLPSSVEFLQNLKSLCLDHCHLEDVTVLGKLTRLQFLSFAMSTISRLPKEIGELTKLRFLDLTGCTRLQVIEPGVLGRLVNLEELYMADSFDQWDDKNEAPRSNANLAELKNMKKLNTLYISIPHSPNLPLDLPFGNLNKHNIQIGGVWDWPGKYKESRTLKLKLYSCNLLLDKWVQRCLQRTQDLHLVGLQDGKDSIHDLCTEGFQELTHLHVQNSPSFHYVVHSTKYIQYFTILEWLFLENLNNLVKICRGCLAPESFSKLKILKVDNCGEIKYLFPLSMTRIFLQLEEIEISNCHLMQQIVSDAETDEDGDEMDVQPKVKSCNLLRLTLRNLPEMTSFCKTEDHPLVYFDKHQLIKLQNLEAMTVERCQLIQEVFDLEGLTVNGDVEILSRLTELTLSDLPSLARIWNKNLRRALCFRNLRTLKVQNCEKLRFLFSSSMAKVLSQIKEIKIVSCELMEEIINVQEEELEEATISNTFEFPLLTSLSFEGLPNLRSFSYREYCIDCPSLTKLTISGCPKMMTFSSFKGRQQSMTTDTGVQQAFGRINSSLPLHGFFNEKVHFPSLEKLKLSSMGQLKRIWHNQLHGKSFCKLASLTVELCENLSHVFPSNSMDRLQSLNKIEVVGCPSLEALFEPVSLSHEKRQKPLVLSALKKMKLLNLPRLRDILKSDCKVTLGFPSLMEVNVRRCHSLPYLFSSATAKTLAKLAVLDVSCCNNLWGIIVMENGEGNIVETLKFPHLSTLKLGDLEKLISFRSASCAGDGLHPLFDEKLALPKLEELHIEGAQHKELWNEKILVESFCHLKVLKAKQCPNLMNVIPSFMWKRLLHCVESLTVEKCPSLRNLCTMSVAKSLGQLKYLGLGGCGEMEYIIATEGEKPEEAANRIVIPQLVTLYLHNMPKLKSFCQGQHISEWPSLKEFTIEDCKAVEVILGDASCRRLEGSVLTQQPLLLVEKVEFPNMESMKISHMDNVQKIWLDDLASNAFSKLKKIVVEYCDKLSSIFSSYTMLTRFQNLEKITVTDCRSLEVVFHVQELNFSEACSRSTFQLRELVLMRLPKMKHIWSELPQGGLTFGCLRLMTVEECERLKSLFPRSVAKSMTQLEELLVQDCGVEEIIAGEDRVGMNADNLFFPRLTDIRLLELPELRSFYQNSHTSTWPLLKELRVRHCAKMRSFSLGTTTSENQPAFFSFEKVISQLEGSTLRREDVVMLQHHTFVNLRHLSLSCYHDENVSFPSDFLLHRFPNLERLAMSCNSFGEIFPEDASVHGGVSLKALGNLKQLCLFKLYNLRRVWRDGSLMAEILKQIEDLFVWQCPSLSIVFLSRASFQRLTELEVDDCAGLVHLGTCSAMTTLVHLTLLILRDCGAMEDVVTDDGNGAEEISFPKLKQLILDRLPSLESFSPTNCAFVFSSLVQITVMQCPKMNTFCKGALRTPNLNEVLLSNKDDEGRWEDDLNTTIQTLLT